MHWPDNGIGVAGAEALAPALKEMTALEELNLYSEFIIVWVVVIECVCSTAQPRPPCECLACVLECSVQVRARAYLFVHCI